MRKTRTIELGTGLFVLLGILSLLFLTTQTSNLETYLNADGYIVTARFDNVGGLAVRAPVTMAGVTIGRVDSIGFDPEGFKAVVGLRIDPQYADIPEDSDASILTSGPARRPIRGHQPRRFARRARGRQRDTIHAVGHRARGSHRQVPVVPGRTVTVTRDA